jgi:glycosyltransferase involved in cell wall biosynthesis
MQPKVSIIIPVYNSEQHISSAITSLNNQTYLNKEIIIVDDGSTDSSYAIAKAFETEACKVIRQTNSGAAIARNTGLVHSSGEFIQFLDVDDFLSSDKIEKQVKALETQHKKVAVCNYIEFFENNDLNLNHLKVDQSDFIYSTDSPVDFLINLYGGYGKAHFIQTNSWLIPRLLIDKAGMWRNYRCPDDDGEFFARILLASEGVVYVPGVYNFYRRSIRDSSLSNNTNKKYLQNSLLTIDLKFRYLSRHIDSAALRKAMAEQYLRFAVYNYPKNKLLSEIANKRFKSIKVSVNTPKIGGKLIKIISTIFGWKIARIIKYYLRERN